MKHFLTLALVSTISFSALAQLNPVKWTFEAVKVSDGVYDLVFKAHIQSGWYVYSNKLDPDDGPIPTTIHFDENDAVQLEGEVREEGDKHEGFDELFMMDILKFSGTPTFTQRVKVSKPTSVAGYLEFMTCDNERCLPPKEVPFQFNLQ